MKRVSPPAYGDPPTNYERVLLAQLVSKGGQAREGFFKWDDAQALIAKGFVFIRHQPGEKPESFTEITTEGRAALASDHVPQPPKEKKTMPRQTKISGTERYKNAKLTEAGEAYKKLRDKAIQAGNKAAEAKQALLDAMRACTDDLAQVDGDFIYVDDEAGLKFIYSNKENVKVRTLKDGDDQDDEG